MSARPLVSFIIPVFQQEAYIAETVKSALAQTLTDIEVIVIDDGSTDRSAAIVESIDDPRLTLLRRTNGGPSAATNDGMLRARGRFIALLGGDDVAEPDRLARQVDFAETRPADIVFSLPTLIDSDGQFLSDATMPGVFAPPSSTEPASIFRRLLVGGNFLCAPTALFRQELVKVVGLFRNDLVQLQDYDYWLRAAAAGKTLAIMRHRVTRHRRHAKNPCGKTSTEASLGEFVGCLFRALSDAPGEIIAKAFPEMMPPGRTSTTTIDRAMIALVHPHSAALGAALILQSFLSQRSELDVKNMSTVWLSSLASAAENRVRFVMEPAMRGD